jgi:hypothetical protein
MTEPLATVAYRLALMKLAQEVDLTSEEWADVPYLLRDNAEKLISQGMIDPDEIAAATVNALRQIEQIRRSEKRVSLQDGPAKPPAAA